MSAQHPLSIHTLSTHKTRQALHALLSLPQQVAPREGDASRAQLLTAYAQARLLALAAAQLKAYNNADLDAFCACYAPHVSAARDGEALFEGQALLRERYEPLFAGGSFGAEVIERRLEPALMGDHTANRTADHTRVSVSCVDVEDWWRGSPEVQSSSRASGRVWVRYHLSLSLDQLKELEDFDELDELDELDVDELTALEGRLGALIERVEFSSSEL